MSAAGMMLPACTMFGDAGAVSRSTLTVRWLDACAMKARLAAWSLCAAASAGTGGEGFGAARPGEAGAAGDAAPPLLPRQTELVRAAARPCCDSWRAAAAACTPGSENWRAAGRADVGQSV